MSGLIIVPIFVFYLIVSYLGLNLIFKLLKLKVKQYIIIAIVILFPFWDLFIQKGIKTFYQIFLLYPTVYEMPERDNEGKIESLDLVSIVKYNERFPPDKDDYNRYKKNVKKFVEVGINSYKEYKRTMKTIKIDLKNDTHKYINKSTARYSFQTPTDRKYIFFGIAYTTKNIIYDRLRNKIIIEGSSLKFTDKFSWFRRNYLFLVTGGSQRDIFYISGAGTHEPIRELLRKN